MKTEAVINTGMQSKNVGRFGVKEGDVYRHHEGQFYKITSAKYEGSEEIIRYVSPRGNRNKLTKHQFKNPVEAKGGKIARFRLANDDPENPWRAE